MSSEQSSNQNEDQSQSSEIVTNPSDISSKNDAELIGYAIEPKLDCPHFNSEDLKNTFSIIDKEILDELCETCEHKGENWICLTCQSIYCSQYINGDMLNHNKNNTDHPIVFSFSDGSFWCYKCDTYITNLEIKQAQCDFSAIKHSNPKNNDQKKENEILYDQNLQNLIDKLNAINLKKKEKEQIAQEQFTYEDLVNGLKNPKVEEEKEGDFDKYNKRQFKKIVFMTGAGISVSAGIPDFRTPGSGLYSQLEKYQLPYPEAIFEINYFKENPQAFYTLSKEFLTCGSHATVSHFFIAETNRRNRLLLNFSQNIDGLEISAGLPEEKLVQAHGHFRTSKCTSCYVVNDIQEFYECAKADKIFYCKSCKKGIVKPDIVFFGEQLPTSFFQNISILKDADLVFVMGTSLKVFPFAALVSEIREHIPIVLVNRENPGIKRNRFLFLEGDIDDSIEKLLKDINWEFPQIERTYPTGTIFDKKNDDNNDQSKL